MRRNASLPPYSRTDLGTNLEHDHSYTSVASHVAIGAASRLNVAWRLTMCHQPNWSGLPVVPFGRSMESDSFQYRTNCHTREMNERAMIRSSRRAICLKALAIQTTIWHLLTGIVFKNAKPI